MRKYFVLNKSLEWTGPLLAESADQAMEIYVTMDDVDTNVPRRILKVETTGQLLEYVKVRAGVYRQA